MSHLKTPLARAANLAPAMGDTFMLENGYQIVIGEVTYGPGGQLLVYASRAGSDRYDLILPLIDFCHLCAAPEALTRTSAVK